MRRLDQIWISHDLVMLMLECKVKNNYILETDHKLILTKIMCNELIENRADAIDRRFTTKRKIFMFNTMTDEMWKSYEDTINTYIGQQNVKDRWRIQQKNDIWLNQTWQLINDIIIKAANKKIPYEIKKKGNKSNRPRHITNTLKIVKALSKLHYKIRKWNDNN